MEFRLFGGIADNAIPFWIGKNDKNISKNL